MKVGDGKPFIAIIVGKTLLKNADEKVANPYVLNQHEFEELIAKALKKGFNVMFQDDSGLIIEKSLRICSICSKLFITVSSSGGAIATIVDLGYVARRETHIRDV